MFCVCERELRGLVSFLSEYFPSKNRVIAGWILVIVRKANRENRGSIFEIFCGDDSFRPFAIFSISKGRAGDYIHMCESVCTFIRS